MRAHRYIYILALVGSACAPTAASVRADLGAESGSPIVGKAFEVHCHAPTAAGCQAVASLLESKYPAIEAFLRVPDHPPDRPIVVELVSDRAAMQAAAEKLNAPPETKGLTSTRTFATYILCASCAQSTPEVDEQATALVEGFEAVGLARIGNWNHEPAWMRQGGALVFAEEQLQAPAMSKRAERVKSLATSGHLPSIDAIIHGELKELSLAERNDLYWGLYRFLRTPTYRARFDEYIERAQTAPLKHFARSLEVNFNDSFGPLDALDAAFRSYASSLSS